MSTQAKYGWAIGLILMGIVFALPFRNATSGDSRVADATANPGSSEEIETRSAQVVDPKTKANGSNLLPNSKRVLEQFDQVAGTQPQGNVVEQVPKKLDLRAAPRESEIARNDQAATLKPVEFSNQQPIPRMADSSGPYRMKPVPSSRFMRASQSSGKPVFSNASRTRKVVQYRLRDGDSLRSIAQRYLGDESRYQEILADNQHLLTNGENFLPVGQFITIIVQ